MLFRRVAQHVKAQNWTAVAIDFIIVVVGVFIGLQVANWNDVRSDSERVATQLASFRTELILARDDFATSRAYYEDRIEGVSTLRRRLEQGGDFPADEFNPLVVSAIRGGSLNMAFPGYEELTTTGAISKVADERLRRLLREWDTQLTLINNTDIVLEDARANLIIPVVLEGTNFGNALQSDERYMDLTVTDRFQFDIEEIRSNRNLDGALAMRQLQAKQQLNTLIDLIGITEALIVALEEANT